MFTLIINHRLRRKQPIGVDRRYKRNLISSLVDELVRDVRLALKGLGLRMVFTSDPGGLSLNVVGRGTIDVSVLVSTVVISCDPAIGHLAKIIAEFLVSKYSDLLYFGDSNEEPDSAS